MQCNRMGTRVRCLADAWSVPTRQTTRVHCIGRSWKALYVSHPLDPDQGQKHPQPFAPFGETRASDDPTVFAAGQHPLISPLLSPRLSLALPPRSFPHKPLWTLPMQDIQEPHNNPSLSPHSLSNITYSQRNSYVRRIYDIRDLHRPRTPHDSRSQSRSRPRTPKSGVNSQRSSTWANTPPRTPRQVAATMTTPPRTPKLAPVVGIQMQERSISVWSAD